MSGVNKVIILGNVGKDPEIRYTEKGTAVANLSIATSEKWTDKNGDKKESTEWHKIVLYDKLASVVGEYIKKGSKVYIEGKLKTRKWQEKDSGKDRYSTEIQAISMQMLSFNKEKDSDGDAQPQHENVFDDEIPF